MSTNTDVTFLCHVNSMMTAPNGVKLVSMRTVEGA